MKTGSFSVYINIADRKSATRDYILEAGEIRVDEFTFYTIVADNFICFNEIEINIDDLRTCKDRPQEL